MGHAVTWFQISAKDGEPLKKFYKSVFAWKTSPGGGGMMMIAPEKGGIAGGVGDSQDGSSSVTVYVSVPSLVGHLKKVEKAGGKTAMPPMELPGNMGSIAGFADPAGNFIGLWQEPKKRAAPRKLATRKPAKKPGKKPAKRR
jgi:predicted enzyme related to lactoylglutathione lyase